MNKTSYNTYKYTYPKKSTQEISMGNLSIIFSVKPTTYFIKLLLSKKKGNTNFGYCGV